jgi:RNA polymerase sigma-70 factor (ECF subfamily)
MGALSLRDREGAGADAAILASVAAGDMSALGQLYDRYDDEVRRVVARLGVRPGDVDDLVQQTFLDVLQCASRFDGRESARPWLVGIACMRVRRHRRSLGRLAARIAAWALEPRVAQERSPEELADFGQRAMLAERALDRLSAKKRDAFVLVVLEGMTGEDAARALGVPAPTVGTRVHHARKEIREFLARAGAQAEGSER